MRRKEVRKDIEKGVDTNTRGTLMREDKRRIDKGVI
jgi:hypothetical protein